MLPNTPNIWVCNAKTNHLCLAVKETNVNVTQDLPVFLNNSKSNKNIVNLSGLFIIGVIFYIALGLNISTRFGWITVSNGMIYFFVNFCCVPVLLPTLYFMRNPKHLVSVLQDHGFM